MTIKMTIGIVKCRMLIVMREAMQPATNTASETQSTRQRNASAWGMAENRRKRHFSTSAMAGASASKPRKLSGDFNTSMMGK